MSYLLETTCPKLFSLVFLNFHHFKIIIVTWISHHLLVSFESNHLEFFIQYLVEIFKMINLRYLALISELFNHYSVIIGLNNHSMNFLFIIFEPITEYFSYSTINSNYFKQLLYLIYLNYCSVIYFLNHTEGLDSINLSIKWVSMEA